MTRASSTTMRPYVLDTPKGPLIEVPIDWVLDDAHHYAFGRGAASMNTPQDVSKAWEWEFDGAHQYQSALILTMQPQVTGRLDKLVALERLTKDIRAHSGVEFMRCIDVAQAWTEQGMRPA